MKEELDYVILSKAVAHALRHSPWLYELELDAEGWTTVASLLDSLRTEREEWRHLEEGDLQEMNTRASKKRYHIEDGRIRALYGHSLPGKIRKERASPPEILYHGTSRKGAESIRKKGLMPMGRQYVHLSLDQRIASLVGRRKDKKPILLKVNAGEAHRHGIAFYRAYEEIWLADCIPPEFIESEDQR